MDTLTNKDHSESQRLCFAKNKEFLKSLNKAVTEDFSKLIAMNLQHFIDHRRTTSTIANLWTGLLFHSHNKQADQLKEIAKFTCGVVLKQSQDDGTISHEYDKTLYNNHTDEQRAGFISQLNEGDIKGLLKHIEAVKEANKPKPKVSTKESDGTTTHNLYQTKAKEVGNLFTQIAKLSEQHDNDEVLIAYMEELETIQKALEEHIDALKAAKKSMLSKVAA